ncbi:MAG: type I-MYXAN CRISPR-associated protein Cas6/Cmx6, partial [bacterium]
LAPPLLTRLIPSTALHSRLVTIKGYTTPESFHEAIHRQMTRLAIHARLKIGPRRIIHINIHKIVGFDVRVENLEEEHSLILQRTGLGGRRKMGCGFFNRTA